MISYKVRGTTSVIVAVTISVFLMLLGFASAGSAATITSVAPALGTTTGGTSVIITGTGFGATQGAGGVTIDGVPATITLWGNTSITCLTPGPHAASPPPVDVVVTPNVGAVATVFGGFTYGVVTITPPVAPDLGPTAGGISVTITGTNFGPPTSIVRFGTTPAASYTSRTDTQIVCVTPAHAASIVDVTVTRGDGGGSFILPGSFTFANVTIASIDTGVVFLTPKYLRSAPTNSGLVQVTIIGTNFDSPQGAGTVTFGTAPVVPNATPTGYVSWTDTQIVCEVPNHTAGPVDVIVTRGDGGGFGTLSGVFSYFNVTVASVVTPNLQPIPPANVSFGPVAGGTAVTITGTNFGPQPAVPIVQFDDGINPAANAGGPWTWTDTQITCVTPASPIPFPGTGAVNVTVIRDDSGSGTRTLGWSYGDVIVASVNPPAPARGTVAGGTVVTINGTSFGALQGTGGVTFDGVPATFPPGSSWADTQIVCTTPPHAAIGAVNVRVTNNAGIFGTLVGGFTYFEVTITPPLVPNNFGSTAGGTVVTINGTNFGAIQGGVQFGGTSADFSIPGSTWTDTSITCTTPGHAAGRVEVVVTRTDGGFGTLPALPVGFNYIGVTITSPLVPAGGSTLLIPPIPPVGTRVIINGSSFGTTLGTVTLGGVLMNILPASWSDTQIVGTTNARAAGLVDVVVTRTDGVTGTLVNGYTYFNATITSVTPVTGPIAGNTLVNIVGTNFLSFGATQGTVTFDGTPATIVSWADLLITCRTPAHAAGAVPVVVRRVDPPYSPPIASAAANFTYGITFIAPLAPFEGPVGGGTVVTIAGTNFGAPQGSGTVTFGGAPATSYTSWVDGQIVCTTPAHLAGPVDVVVTRDGGIISGTSLASGYQATGFFYGVLINTVTVPPAPVGTLAVGPVTGGTWVDIVGDNFGAFQGTGSVTFGGAAANFPLGSIWSNTLLRCVTQPHLVPGLFHVVVTKNGLPPFISGTLENSFYYGVTVTSVAPTFGPITGGTTVTIVGANFGPFPGGINPANVRFGGIPAIITSWTNTQIVCVTPASVAGAVDVVVTRNDGIDGVLVNGFFYGVGITSVTPNVGPTGLPIPPDTATVTITGTNFGAAQGALGSVTFGGIPATSYTSWSNTQVVCKTPPHVAGAVNVVVTRSDGVVAGTSVPPLGGFFYGVVITSLTPNVTPTAGTPAQMNVIIYGQNFGPTPGTGSVTFGGILATPAGTWWSDTRIECTAPAHLVAGNPVPGAVDVVVTRNDGIAGTLLAQPSPPGFYYGVTVTSITPNVGPIAGGTVVTILGDNFGTSPGPGGGVTFLGFGFPATDYVWSNTSITCVVPAFPFPIPPLLLPGFTVQSDVVVTRNDGVNGVLVNGFTYGVGITSVTPALGPTTGDTTVTIAGSPFGDFVTVGAGTVTFGGIPTTTVFNATNWTNTQIMCKTPPHVAGPVSVVVTRHDGAADGVLPNGFFYGIVINTVTPNVGSEVPPLTFPVDIAGDNFGFFQGTGSVTFGGTPAVIAGWTNNLITCTAPAHAAGPVNIVVTRDGGPPFISATVVNGFTYGVTINTVTPTGGPVAGGTSVIIAGANFGITQGTVVFGVPPFDPPAAITSWSDTQIVCVTPPRILGPGAVDVRVTRGTPDATFGIKALGFFYGIVTVASVAPALGPVAGGTPVTIIGTNFGAISGGVTFGGLAAPIISGGWTDTQIQCLTPAHAAGAFDVVVTRTGGIVSDVLPHKVFIYGVVTVTSVTPALGPVAGSTVVTITGTNFGAAQGAVTFGGAAATIIPANWTNTQIICTTSAHLAGLVDVVVARADDVVTAGIHSGQGALASGFLYGAVTITSVTPALGPVAGGTPVTIAGTNFGATAGTVTFDGIAATDVVWGATITCKTPPHAAGAVNVVVTRADGAVPSLPSVFTYGTVTVASVTPNAGPTGGSTSVTIAGTNFGATAGTVTFDGIAATDVVWGATITCKTPGPHAVGAVPVVVTRGDGGGSGTQASGFTYSQQFKVFINGVVVSPTTRVEANVNVNFSVEVWINGITSAKLFYKKGGEASYSAPITLNPTGAPWTWSNNIPALDVTARGLLYYVEVNGATHLFYPGEAASAPAIPANISVHAPSSFAFYTTPPAHSNVYNLIAPNGRPDDDNLRTVVGPVFNEGGGGTWIAWGYNPSAGIFVRLPNTAGTFIPGQSWFFAKDGSGMPQAVPFSSTSVDASVPFEIILQPGWNLVANPFAFPVAWSDTGIEIRDSADNPYTPTQANIGGVVSDKLHWLNPATGSYIKRVSSEDPPFTMMPNQGEWLFSGVAGAKMRIKPIFHVPTAIESPAAPKKDMTAWEVTLSLQSSAGSDSVTAAVGKSTGKVELNQIKSPGMPLAPYIALIRDDQVGAASMLSSDVRAINDELTWSIKATASSEVSLDWSLVNVPDDYMLSLEDQAGKVVNLRQDSAIHLGVGVYSFILKAEKKALIPKATKLLVNYPNPFNPETWIPFELSKDTDVTIKIYASNGQLVRSLELGHKMAGFYSSKDKAAHWDGKNEAGEQVSSGIYFYNIQAGNYKDIRKMVIVQ